MSLFGLKYRRSIAILTITSHPPHATPSQLSHPFTPPLCTPPPYNMGLGQNCLGCVSFWCLVSQIYSYINHTTSSTQCHPFPGIPPPVPHPCVPHPLANMGLGQNCFGCVSFWSQISQIYSHINHNISSTPSLFTPPLCTPPLANMGLGFNWLYFACRRWCYTEAAGPAGPHDSRWSGDLRNNFRGAASHS